MKLKLVFIFTIIFLAASFSNIYAAEEILSWGDCIKEAAKNHPDLIASQEVIKQSVATKQETASTLFPQITGELSASTAKTAGTSISSTADSYSYGVSATQLIFDGVQTINNVKAASEDIAAAKQGYRFTSTSVRFKLRSAFVDLLKVQEMLRIAEEIYNIRRGNLELITLRYQSGLEHMGALLTAEADLADAKYTILKNKRSVEVARQSLVKEMGRQNLTPIYARGDFKVKDSALEKPDFTALVKNNPSIQQLTFQVRSAEFGLKSTYGSFFPELTGSAGANRTGAHWLPTGAGDQYSLGLGVSLPLFEGGLRTAQIAGAKALLKELQEKERSMRDSVILTLQQTWAALQDAIENVNVQNKVLIATEERSKIAQAQYSIGFVSFDNWIIIEDNLVNAKSNYLDAQAASLLAEAKWIQAKGETIEYE